MVDIIEPDISLLSSYSVNVIDCLLLECHRKCVYVMVHKINRDKRWTFNWPQIAILQKYTVAFYNVY